MIILRQVTEAAILVPGDPSESLGELKIKDLRFNWFRVEPE